MLSAFRKVIEFFENRMYSKPSDPSLAAYARCAKPRTSPSQSVKVKMLGSFVFAYFPETTNPSLPTICQTLSSDRNAAEDNSPSEEIYCPLRSKPPAEPSLNCFASRASNPKRHIHITAAIHTETKPIFEKYLILANASLSQMHAIQHLRSNLFINLAHTINRFVNNVGLNFVLAIRCRLIKTVAGYRHSVGSYCRCKAWQLQTDRHALRNPRKLNPHANRAAPSSLNVYRSTPIYHYATGQLARHIASSRISRLISPVNNVICWTAPKRHRIALRSCLCDNTRCFGICTAMQQLNRLGFSHVRRNNIQIRYHLLIGKLEFIRSHSYWSCGGKAKQQKRGNCGPASDRTVVSLSVHSSSNPKKPLERADRKVKLFQAVSPIFLLFYIA